MTCSRMCVCRALRTSLLRNRCPFRADTDFSGRTSWDVVEGLFGFCFKFSRFRLFPNFGSNGSPLLFLKTLQKFGTFFQIPGNFRLRFDRPLRFHPDLTTTPATRNCWSCGTSPPLPPKLNQLTLVCTSSSYSARMAEALRSSSWHHPKVAGLCQGLEDSPGK